MYACVFVCVCQRWAGVLEEESCLPGTEDYGTAPHGMLKTVGVWEGWSRNHFMEQSHLLESFGAAVSSFTPPPPRLRLSPSTSSTYVLFVTPKIFRPSPFTGGLLYLLIYLFAEALNHTWFPNLICHTCCLSCLQTSASFFSPLIVET